MTVRNSAFAVGSAANPANLPIYTVPDNNVLLLKQASFTNSGTLGAPISVILYRPSTTLPVFLPALTPDANGRAVWSGWVALNGGDQIVLSVATATCYFWLSGALLPYATL
jgi:hypothetical protein